MDNLGTSLIDLTEPDGDLGDMRAAEFWWLKAAGLGHLGAIKNLISLYSGPGDEDAAVPWWTILAEDGDNHFRYLLADYYEERGDHHSAENWRYMAEWV